MLQTALINLDWAKALINPAINKRDNTGLGLGNIAEADIFKLQMNFCLVFLHTCWTGTLYGLGLTHLDVSDCQGNNMNLIYSCQVATDLSANVSWRKVDPKKYKPYFFRGLPLHSSYWVLPCSKLDHLMSLDWSNVYHRCRHGQVSNSSCSSIARVRRVKWH